MYIVNIVAQNILSSQKVANKENSFNDCCSHGSVKLNLLPQLPYELYVNNYIYFFSQL